MAGVVDSGVGVGLRNSPYRDAIEEARAALRKEIDLREKWIKELKFLEQGGDPLDFKLDSFANQQPEHVVTGEAMGSFVVAASSSGVSVESRGREGDPPTNSEPEEKMNYSAKRLPQMYVDRIYKDHPKDSAIFHPYSRRNRSRSNRNVARSGFDTKSSLPTLGESTESSLQKSVYIK